MTEAELEKLEAKCNAGKSIVANMFAIKTMLSSIDDVVGQQIPVTYNGRTVIVIKERFISLLEQALKDCDEQLEKL